MDEEFLARFRERSAYETGRDGPPDGFPKAPRPSARPVHRPLFQALEDAEHLRRHMDDKYLARFLERSAFESARAGPPEDFPKLRDLPLGRYTDPLFQNSRTSTSSSGLALRRPRQRAAEAGQLSAVRARRRADPARPGRRRPGTGVPQRLPPPRCARRPRRERFGTGCSCASSTRGATTCGVSSCGCPTSGTSSD